MINVNDFKNGQTINYDGNLYQVLDFNHVKPGKGAAIVKAKLKNLRTGSIAEYTFNAGIKVPTAHVEKQKMQFLYADGDTYSFMNMETYEQVELNKKQIENEGAISKEFRTDFDLAHSPIGRIASSFAISSQRSSFSAIRWMIEAISASGTWNMRNASVKSAARLFAWSRSASK